MPRSTVATHPRLGQIEAALRAGQTVRAVAAEFGLSRNAVHRHKQSMLIDPAEQSTPRPVRRPPPARRSSEPSASGPPGCSGTSDPAISDDGFSGPSGPEPAETFDLISMSYPWSSPDERAVIDPVAGQLRDKQQRFGTDAIRRTVLDLVSDFGRSMDDNTIARKLDVPPYMIQEWRSIKQREILDTLSSDPTEDVVHQLSAFETIERTLSRTINDPRSSEGARGAAIDRWLRMDRLRHDRREALGLVRRVRLPEQILDEPDGGADRFGAEVIRASLDNFTVTMASVLGIDIEGKSLREAAEAIEPALQARMARPPVRTRTPPDPEPADAASIDETDDEPEAEVVEATT